MSDKINAPDELFLKDYCSAVSSIDLLKKGFAAFKDVKGLKLSCIKGVLLTTLTSTIVFVLLFFYLYQPFIFPYLLEYSDKAIAFWDPLKYVIIPLTIVLKLLVWALLAYVSIKTSLIVMSLWVDHMIEKVINHFRGIPEDPFTLKELMKSISISIKRNLFNFMQSVPFIILAFIPVIGPIIAFIGLTRVNSTDILAPYIEVLIDKNRDMQDYKIKTSQAYSVGLLQATTCFVPVVGWMLFPMTLMIQNIGYSYLCEESYKENKSTGPIRELEIERL